MEEGEEVELDTSGRGTSIFSGHLMCFYSPLLSSRRHHDGYGCPVGFLLKGDKSLEVEEVAVNVQRPSRKSVTKMLFVLVMVFAVCWAPFHIDRLFFSFVVEWTEPLANIFNLIHVVSGIFFYLSSAVNPIIYNLLSQRFRMAFLSVISPCCKHWAPAHPSSKIPAQQSIFVIEDHNLMDSAEDTSLPGTHRTSVSSSQLSTGL